MSLKITIAQHNFVKNTPKMGYCEKKAFFPSSFQNNPWIIFTHENYEVLFVYQKALILRFHTSFLTTKKDKKKRLIYIYCICGNKSDAKIYNYIFS